MAIQVKFLEQWFAILSDEKESLKGEPDHYLDGQLNTLDTIISINNKTSGRFKTLKSYLKAYRNKVRSQQNDKPGV